MDITSKELKEWFEHNFLDGDIIQKGQMLSSSFCFEAIEEAVKEGQKKVIDKVIEIVDCMTNDSITLLKENMFIPESDIKSVTKLNQHILTELNQLKKNL